MSPIFIPRAPAERPQLLSGVTTGSQTLMPWERLDNPILNKFMLPGSEEFSPNALKERAKVNIFATTFAPSGQGGGGEGGSGGKSGGGGVSYMPGGSPIGKGLPKAWSAPQGNFEDAKGKGELTPEKVKQAQDFAAAHGRTFDPALGYSTNTKPQAQAPQQSQPGTPATPSTTPAPASAPKAAAGGGSDPYPHVFDGGKPVLTEDAKRQGIEGWDENGAPKYAFAGGTPGVPVKALKGKPFWVGEEGPELARVKDGKLTVVPNHEIKAAGVTPPKPRRAWAFADMAEGRGFADGTGTDPTQTMEDRQSWSPVFAPTNGPVLRTAPSADRVVATPATPQTAFPTQSTEQGFTPAFSPTFAPTLSAPPGVRQTDFRRFLRTPQGMQYALGHEAQNQSSAAHNQSRTAAMNTERQWQMDDKNAAKTERDAKEKEDEASIDSIIGSLSGSETTLDPVWRDIVKSAKGAKGKQAALDLAIRHAMDKDAEKRRSEREGGKAVTGSEFITDGSGQFGVPVVVHKDGSRSPIGGALPLGKTAPATAPKTAKGSDGRTYQWHPEQGWTPLGNDPAPKPAKFRVYNDKGHQMDLEGNPEEYDLTGWTLGPQRKTSGAQPSGAKGAKPSSFAQKFGQ